MHKRRSKSLVSTFQLTWGYACLIDIQVKLEYRSPQVKKLGHRVKSKKIFVNHLGQSQRFDVIQTVRIFCVNENLFTNFVETQIKVLHVLHDFRLVAMFKMFGNGIHCYAPSGGGDFLLPLSFHLSVCPSIQANKKAFVGYRYQQVMVNSIHYVHFLDI